MVQQLGIPASHSAFPTEYHSPMSMPEVAKKTTRRLDPAVRKHMILDKAAILVAAEGISAVTMERVASEAGVSKPLVYAYFPNVTTLLQELLVRDQRRLWELQAIAVSEAKDFDELIRFTTRTYLKHAEKNGMHIQRLMGEPSITAAFQELERESRQRVVDTLATEMVHNFNVPRDVAILTTEVSMGLTGAAGELVSKGVVGRRKIEEIVFCLFKGSLVALEEKYGKADLSSAA
jgi:TetR/AcrR family transcriptional regulator, fatty acid biosynthesis regulator